MTAMRTDMTPAILSSPLSLSLEKRRHDPFPPFRRHRMPPAVRVGILAPGSVASSYVAVVVVVVVIPRLASTVPITTREQDERRSPSSPPPAPRSHRLRPTLPLRRPPRRLCAHGRRRRRRGRFGRVDRRQQQDHDGRGLHAAERSRECVWSIFFGGGSSAPPPFPPISSLPHPPPHTPHPNRSFMLSSLLRAISLSLSVHVY